MVKLYLSSGISYRELAIEEGINNPALLAKWVKDFRIAGPDALIPKKKGRKKSLESLDLSNKKNDSASRETATDGTSTEYIKHPENELLKLRIENAYLKELRRLRLEEETLLKRKRESSTASGENSN